MSKEIGINIDDGKYYLVWVAPSPDFPEERIQDRWKFNSYLTAKWVADDINKQTKGVQGTYEVRKEVA